MRLHRLFALMMIVVSIIGVHPARSLAQETALLTIVNDLMEPICQVSFMLGFDDAARVIDSSERLDVEASQSWEVPIGVYRVVIHGCDSAQTSLIDFAGLWVEGDNALQLEAFQLQTASLQTRLAEARQLANARNTAAAQRMYEEVLDLAGESFPYQQAQAYAELGALFFPDSTALPYFEAAATKLDRLIFNGDKAFKAHVYAALGYLQLTGEAYLNAENTFRDLAASTDDELSEMSSDLASLLSLMSNVDQQAAFYPYVLKTSELISGAINPVEVAPLEAELFRSQAGGDRNAEAEALIRLGLAARDRDENAIAEARLQEGSHLALELGETRLAGEALLGLATIEQSQGQISEAVDLIGEASARFLQANDRFGVAAASITLASVQVFSNAPEQAMQTLALAQETAAQLDDPVLVIWANLVLSQAYSVLGDDENSVAVLEIAAQKASALENPRLDFAVTLSLGEAYFMAGNYGETTNVYLDLVDISALIGEPFYTAIAHAAVAESLTLMGDYDEALVHTLTALESARADGCMLTLFEAIMQAVTLEWFTSGSITGNSLALLMELQELTVTHLAPTKELQVVSLLGAGQMLQGLGTDGEMVAVFLGLDTLMRVDALLNSFDLPNARELSSLPLAQSNLELLNAIMWLEIGNYAKAIQVAGDLTTTAQTNDNDYLEVLGLTIQGVALWQSGDSKSALSTLEPAAVLSSKLINATGLDDFRLSLVGQSALALPFDLLSFLLPVNNRLENGLYYTEQGRAVLTRLQLQDDAIDFRSNADAELLAQEREYIDALEAAKTMGDDTAIDERDTAFAALQAHWVTMQDEGGFLARERVAFTATSQQIIDSLPENALLLVYNLNTFSGSVYVVEDNPSAPIRFYTLPEASLEVVREQARSFHASSQTQIENLRRLYDILISPIENELQMCGDCDLIIAADDMLQTIPFAALQSPNREYLIDHHVISMTPSGTTLYQLRQRQAVNASTSPGLVVSQDAAIPEQGLPALPNAREEVRAVADLLDVAPIINASETEFRAMAPGSEVIFIAAHAQLSDLSPLFNAIYLGASAQHNGLLEAYEIFELDLSHGTELVVLSGCNTASEIEGEGFNAFIRAFFAAGAPRVVASLWTMQDRAAYDLTTRFMQRRKSGQYPSDAAALREAMLEVRDSVNSNPAYWSGFVLTGLP